MKFKKVDTINTLEKGPMMAYQCDCACPKSTPTKLKRTVGISKKSQVPENIFVTIDL